jgi:Fic-DOC domain mobile mystery protein B
MGLKLDYKEGQTPLSEEEKEGLLITTITTHGELDEFEQMNIEKAVEWTMTKKFKKEYIISDEFVKELHYKMFNDVWAWAGKLRLSEKNLGVKFHAISTQLRLLNDDCLFWIENKTYTEEEIAIYYKHRIVNIHCFPNGNGRHSRLIADVIINQIFKKDFFTWSSTNLVNKGKQRNNYLNAIREADKQNIQPLIDFARS